MTTYYLNADTGNDSTGNGTSGNPWQSLAKGVSGSSAGDTIYLQNSVAAYSLSSMTIASARTITGQSVSGAVLDGANSSARLILTGASAIYDISNLTLQNVDQGNNYLSFFYAQAISNTLNLTNCAFINIKPGQGFYFDGGGGGPVNVSGCLFAGFQEYVQYINSFFAMSGNLTCVASTFYSTAPAAYALTIVSGAALAVLKNNNFITQNARTFGSASSFAGSTNNNTYGYTSIPAGLANNISVDPLFVNAANNNFNLRPTSPCINAGAII